MNQNLKCGCVVCPTRALKDLCIANGYLAHATIAQCNKIFEANDVFRLTKDSHSYSVQEIVSMIWLCSDQPREEIAKTLIDANNRYLANVSARLSELLSV